MHLSTQLPREESGGERETEREGAREALRQTGIQSEGECVCGGGEAEMKVGQKKNEKEEGVVGNNGAILSCHFASGNL